MQVDPSCTDSCKPRRCECIRSKGFVRAGDGACIPVVECFKYRYHYISPGNDPDIPPNSLWGRLLAAIQEEALVAYGGDGLRKRKGKKPEPMKLQNGMELVESEQNKVEENGTNLSVTDSVAVGSSSEGVVLPAANLLKKNFTDKEALFDKPKSRDVELRPVSRVSLVEESASERFAIRCLPHCCEPPCGSCEPPCGMNCPPPCGK